MTLAKDIPPNTGRVYDDFHVIKGNDAVIISDIEIPDQDNWMMRAALLAGMRFNIKKLTRAGDLVATDQDALNTWLTIWAEEGGSTYAGDLEQLDHLSAVYNQWFDEQYAITGNHDMRIDKKTGERFTAATIKDKRAKPCSNSLFLRRSAPSG